MTTATGDDDNGVDGDGVMGNEVDDDGNGVTGNEVDDDGDGRRVKTTTMTMMATATARWTAARQDTTMPAMATGDDNNNDDDGDGNGVMGSGMTGYDDDNNGDGQ